MFSLTTNISDLILQRTLYDSTISLNDAILKMTTGSKLNHAKDNAAGYSIVTNLSTKISSMLQIQQNSADGIDLLKTAEGGLQEIQGLFDRLRSLTMQAANGTYDNNTLASMQKEADSIVEEIERIKNSINYNSINLYEASSDGAANPVTRLARSAKVSNNSEQTNLNKTTLNISDTFAPSSAKTDELTPLSETNNLMVSSVVAEQQNGESVSSSPSVFSLQSTNSVQPASLDNGISTIAEGDIIEGSYDFSGSETKTITIDGTNYTVKSRVTTAQTLSYTKNKTTNELTFIGNDFEITGQQDKQHDIIINGSRVIVRGGNLNDKFQLANSNCANVSIYGGDGDDEIIVTAKYTTVYGEGGNDIITTSSFVGQSNYYGGEGDDTFNISGTDTGGYYYGGEGSDLFNVYSSGSYVFGEGGEDNFIINSGANDVTVNGGDGINSITDNGVGTKKFNVPGATLFSVDVIANVAKKITINNIEYTITKTTSGSLGYKINDDGQIVFTGDGQTGWTIIGQTDKAHNVKLENFKGTFYGGDLADTIISTGFSTTIYGQGGNDIIQIASYSNAYGGDGDDTIYLKSNYSRVYGEAGDDTINITSTSGSYIDVDDGKDNINITGKITQSTIAGGSGTKTLTGDYEEVLIAGINETVNNAQMFSLNGNESKTITIAGKNYTFTSNDGEDKKIVYNYDTVSQVVELGGDNLNIQAQEDVSHNVLLIGKSIHFTGGEKNDTIIAKGYASKINGGAGDDNITFYLDDNTIYGGAGNDTIVAKAQGFIQGEDGDDIIIIDAKNAISYSAGGGSGNDTFYVNKNSNVTDTGGNNVYYINVDGANITGGPDDDTFYVAGSNNTVSGGSGNDYFVIDGDNNNIDGGTGDNNYVNNGNGTISSNATNNPNSGIYNFTSGETKTILIEGKTYTVKNTTAQNNSLQYSYNKNTEIITFFGSGYQIDAESDEAAFLNIRGDDNVINASILQDKIIIEQGSNNIINTFDGDDIITMNSANNSILSGEGKDTINLNASTNLEVNSGGGNDIVNVVSNNNTNINLGSGNDSVKIDGTGNTIKGNDGNNVFTLNGGNNNISATSGDNRLIVNSSDNTVVVTGSGNNKLRVQGDNNLISVGNVNGDISIKGNGNEVTNTTGKNNVNISGSNNTYSTVSGDKNITVIGSDNNITGGSGNDSISLRGDYNTAFGGEGNDKFVVKQGTGNTVDGNGGKNTIIDNTNVAVYTNATLLKSEPFKLNLKVDIGSRDDAYISTEISFNLEGFAVDLSSRNNALMSLNDIDEYIKKINDQLLNIGTTINRLEAVAEAQSVKLNNLISTRSTLRDADIAQESSDFVKYQILQQASATLMASSRNLRAENVLGLLQGVKG